MHVTYVCIILFHQQYCDNNDTTITINASSVLSRIWIVWYNDWILWSCGFLMLLCTWSLVSLTCFHAFIVSIAQTTNERVRGIYRYSNHNDPNNINNNNNNNNNNNMQNNNNINMVPKKKKGKKSCIPHQVLLHLTLLFRNDVTITTKAMLPKLKLLCDQQRTPWLQGYTESQLHTKFNSMKHKFKKTNELPELPKPDIR
uniref:Uncharacterized protein n=1 Tax=Eucampia antarctica TaxID=49252 RepID=A0A6U0SGB7_9STRA|mmetsp:Transcript_27557/g.26405  ORF Transcript_27557/g.26405 Transcript_27557/m.26405 type:complete len:200 (+) Transcript_27557:353-952(+)